MKEIVQHTAEKVSDWIEKIEAKGTKQQQFCYILNKDQSIRWLWPANASKPLFLKFYSISSLQSHVFSMLCRLVFFLNIQRLVFKTETTGLRNLPWKLNIDQTEDWALFTGTVGPNRKIVITGKTIKGVDSFVKFPIGKLASQKLNTEIDVYDLLEEISFTSIATPKRLHAHRSVLQMTELGVGQRSLELTKLHYNFFNEVERKTLVKNKNTSKEFISKLTSNSEYKNAIKDGRIPKGIIRKVTELGNHLSSHRGIETTFAHGDFTAWNTYIQNDKLAVYDWELGNKELPLGYDAFHFIIQNGLLVKRLSWLNIYEELKSSVLPNVFQNDAKKFDKYLNYYLIHILTTNAVVFASQSHWHMQIQWLFSGWNDAISQSLSKISSSRKLILTDLFDFVHPLNYTTLKFKSELPENVSEFSDVDLCIGKKDAKKVYKYLAAHPLIKRMSSSKKTFMQNLSMTCSDGQHLSLDLIWKLKRKNLVFQNINDILTSSRMNDYGVQIPSLIQESVYVNSFYILNDAPVPENYKSVIIDHELETESKNTKRSNSQKATLKTLLKKRAYNKGLSGLLNALQYAFDSITTLFTNKGFIITFSGVDGAGKSTLIEIAKTRIEKQLRKPVVVLRHRPSILPIINALFVGKEKAQEQALKTLPHDGNNTSFVSSLVRFTYYYLDYLFGQFYIQLKYVRRGKVVIYDRYYYDFISDSKRSNILLPKWIAKLGLKLVLKPELNFFIYAESSTILKRKQELDASKITELTSSYMKLFKRLDKRTNSKFLGIENIDLDVSVDRIMTNVKLQAS